MSTRADHWRALEDLAREGADLKTMFSSGAARFDRFHLDLDGFLMDFSRQDVTADILQRLLALAASCGLGESIAGMFTGAPVNSSENRPALHVALRGSVAGDLHGGGENVSAFVAQTLGRMQDLAETLRAGDIDDVVHIGIGGSDLGPRLVCDALRDFSAGGPRLHFAANVDPDDLDDILKTCTPARTAFIVCSKTFGTQETLLNAAQAKNWLGPHSAGRMIAVTANEAAARAFGMRPEMILPLREWIGGRFSLWSAVGLCIAVQSGMENFRRLLDGARAMDEHFRDAPHARNMPVMLGLLGVWQRNFRGRSAAAFIPYAHRLRLLPEYLQQIEMESGGKTARAGTITADCDTAPAVFGQTGTNAQHAFMQMMHQGSEIIPCDFILCARPFNPTPERNDRHDALIANALAQAQALLHGRADDCPDRNFPGNRPSTTIMLPRLDAYYLGMLLALYEHKTFVQSIIWQINAFDQWGVELGKTLARSTLHALQAPADTHDALDAVAAALIARIRSAKT